MRCIHGGLEPAVSVRVQPELVQAGGEVALVENTQHAFLAVNGRQEGDAQINVASADFDAHAAVLREAALGDVQIAHDLDSRGEGHLHVLGRRRHVHQRTVNAIAQADGLLEGLDVDIARAVFDGLHDDKIGQLNDGRLFRRGGQLVEIYFLRHFARNLQRVLVRFFLRPRLALGILDDVFHRVADGVQVVQLVEDGPFRGDHRHHVQPGEPFHVVERQDVQRVGHRQKQFVVQPRDGQHFMVGGHFARDQAGDFLGNADADQIDGGHVQHAAHGDDHVDFADIGFLQNQLEQAPSFFCSSSNSSTCRFDSRPSSTSASAIRSPKLLMGRIKSDD